MKRATIDALGLPPAVHQVLTKKSGLVLVATTGSGKSTSLAAMIDKTGERNENIITSRTRSNSFTRARSPSSPSARSGVMPNRSR